MSSKTIIRMCAIVMGFSGLIILVGAVYPIISYEWESAERYPLLLSPLVDQETGELKIGKDYTKASNWIEGEHPNFSSNVQTYFSLSIPALKIDHARVAIGSEDLSDSLIQYPDTALPGRVGNAVIFGHSVLPQYFNPENYLSIFSTLNKLKSGDNVYVYYDGVTYTYSVETLFEVLPTDIEILSQSSEGAYLTLVTCSPPGHPLKPRRLIVRAKLVPFS